MLGTLGAVAPRFCRADTPATKPGSFSVDRFDPAPPGDRFESVNGANIDGEELFRAGVILEYARAPLVVRDLTSPILDHQLVLHASVSLALWERLSVNGSLPVVLVNQGTPRDRPVPPGGRFAAPNAASLGNILLGARLQLLGAPRKAAQLAVAGSFWLPTGETAELTGDSRLRAMPYASFSGGVGRLAYASHVGVLFQRSQDVVDVHLGPELRFGMAGAFVSTGDRLQVGAELNGSAPLEDGAGQAEGLWSGEVLGTGRVRLGDVVLGAGFGPGLVRGVGTPLFRGLLSFAFAPMGEKDVDHDGIIDMLDACPTVKGSPDEDPEQNGCPSDRDADGILDVVDSCPDEPGVRSKDPARNGCPVPTDRDGDGTPDKVDACPDDRGSASPDP